MESNRKRIGWVAYEHKRRHDDEETHKNPSLSLKADATPLARTTTQTRKIMKQKNM